MNQRLKNLGKEELYSVLLSYANIVHFNTKPTSLNICTYLHNIMVIFT